MKMPSILGSGIKGSVMKIIEEDPEIREDMERLQMKIFRKYMSMKA
ncbi:MAG: hypothetical protein M1544_02850 [Candidatus Marsarchaeota archaeon]|nr:hypothetical protein [Candidatus Marsarchaeota archaeon]